MKVAHQGVPVAGLPGLAAGTALVSAVPPAAIIPPATIGRDPPPPQSHDGGLDGWFIDRLFGRH
jgi:hypothetical protein